mgnify:CR=1 FL=1
MIIAKTIIMSVGQLIALNWKNKIVPKSPMLHPNRHHEVFLALRCHVCLHFQWKEGDVVEVLIVELIICYLQILIQGICIWVKMPTSPSHISQLQRLRRIEGQIRGVIKMIEDKRYCMDILQQTRAISAALKAVENNIMEDHMTSCVATALKSNKKRSRQIKSKKLLKW